MWLSIKGIKIQMKGQGQRLVINLIINPIEQLDKLLLPKRFNSMKTDRIDQQLKQAPPLQNIPVQAKSFLSMISPMKNRTSSALQGKYDEKENIQRSNNTLIKSNESFSKKNVTKCINSIKQTMNTLCDSLRNLKQKSHGLVLQSNPFFTNIAASNAPVAKQVGDFKNKLKSLEALIEALHIVDSDEIVEKFHKNLEQHLQSQEGHLRKYLQKTKGEELSSIKAQKDRLIQRLQNQNTQLNKEIDLLQRKLQKAESRQGSMEEAVMEREIDTIGQFQKQKLIFQASFEELNAKHLELTERCENLTEKNRQCKKQLKSQRFQKEKVEGKFRQEVQHIVEAKDAYLLNEIMVLKEQFSADLNQVSELHKVKEAEWLNRIRKKDVEINKLTFERDCDRQVESKISEEVNQIKQENAQLKTKTDCIITDMYRMNEQLYQHWIALKDIKALTNRLGSFAQLKTIYEDLLFNDHLFH